MQTGATATRRPRTSAPWRALAVLAGLVAGVFVLPAVAAAAPGVPTQLSAADLALLNGVRQADLWEMPAGKMAAARGHNTKVREIGETIAEQHLKLDQDLVEVANKLTVTLPTQPSVEQQRWLKEMQGASSNQEFDYIFVARLRAAHGKVFQIIAAVRASTRNELVRGLATEANKIVMGHLNFLESTGLVRYGELPPAALPQQDLAVAGSLRQAAQGRAAAGSGFSPTVVWVVLIAAVVTGGASAYRAFRPK